MLSFYLLFLLYIAGLAISAPITRHRHHLLDSHFPYGKLADKLLNVNDRIYDVYDVSYMIDDFDEDMVRVYPESHSVPFSSESALPISSFELPPPTRNVSAKNFFSFVYQIPDFIKEVVTHEWEIWFGGVRWL